MALSSALALWHRFADAHVDDDFDLRSLHDRFVVEFLHEAQERLRFCIFLSVWQPLSSFLLSCRPIYLSIGFPIFWQFVPFSVSNTLYPTRVGSPVFGSNGITLDSVNRRLLLDDPALRVGLRSAGCASSPC